MRPRTLPALAVALATAWLVASVMGSGWLAALVAATVIAALSALAPRRRRHGAQRLAAAVLGILSGALLLILMLPATWHGTALLLQLLFALILFPAVPLVYALSFDRDSGEDSP